MAHANLRYQRVRQAHSRKPPPTPAHNEVSSRARENNSCNSNSSSINIKTMRCCSIFVSAHNMHFALGNFSTCFLLDDDESLSPSFGWLARYVVVVVVPMLLAVLLLVGSTPSYRNLCTQTHARNVHVGAEHIVACCNSCKHHKLAATRRTGS